jgi:hypothetical protein
MNTLFVNGSRTVLVFWASMKSDAESGAMIDGGETLTEGGRCCGTEGMEKMRRGARAGRDPAIEGA